MKADTVIFEEIAQLLSRSTSRLDEIDNHLKFIRAEIVDDVEFMLFDQADSVIDSTQTALTKIERAYTICDSLTGIIRNLPSRYLELDQSASNKISNLMMILEQIKINTSVLDSPNFVFAEQPRSDVVVNEGRLAESLAVSNISLSTSVIQGQLKVTRIEDINGEH